MRDVSADDWAPPAAPKGGGKALTLGLVGLAVFLAWQALELRSFIRRETRPPAWDQAIHLEIALDYRKAAGHGGLAKEILSLAPKPGMPPFPPLYHLGLMRAYDHPNPAGAALWLNWFYLALACVSLFAIAYHFRPDESALVAAVLFACAPAVRRLYTTQLIDLALTAWVAAAYWVLLRSDRFRRWPSSLLFGAAFGIGMMHKWSFFSYLLPAYYVGLQALTERQSRPKALAAAAVALAAFAPWYLVHMPIVFPRLIEASLDFATPRRWQNILAYFLNTADGLGPALWVLALGGLVAPFYRRNGDKYWLIPLWFLTSFAFWAAVPNQQIRFLLPGLAALAVAAACGAWPKPLILGATIFQVFVGTNFLAGWISAFDIPLPYHTLELLPSSPPLKQDWKIADILREAQKRHDPQRKVSNLTLVANDVYFNGPNFTWMSKYLALPDVTLRGVNRRLCEFSAFVALKTGSLGPPQVIAGLPAASEAILRKDGWFQRAYAEAARWPLPDGSEAILFQQRKLTQPPFKDKSVSFGYYSTATFSAANLKVALGDWDASRSAYRLSRITASEMDLRGLRLAGVSLVLEDWLAIPAGEDPARAPWDDIRLLKMGALRIDSLDVSAEDLKKFLEARVRGLSVDRISLDKTITIAGRVKNLSFSGEASAALLDSPRRLQITWLDARIGVSPVPAGLLNRFKTFTISLEPNPETPFAVVLPGLTIKDGHLRVP